MPDIIKGTKKKTPISGGGAYVDYGGGRSAGQTSGKSGGTLGGLLARAIVEATKKATRDAIAGGSRTTTPAGQMTSNPTETRPAQETSYTGAGYAGTAGSGGNDLSDYLRRQQAASTEAALAGLKGAYDKNVLQLDAQRGKIPGLYDAQRNTLAANTAQDRRSFDERAAAAGLNSGTSGQAELTRSSVLQQGMAGLGESEAEALADIDLAKSQLQAEYETAAAQRKAQDEAALQDRLYEEAVRQQNAGSGSYSSYRGGGSSSGSSLREKVAETIGTTGSKTADAVNAGSGLVKSVAEAIFGGIPGKREKASTGSSGSQLVSVPGYGQISYDDAETLEQQGYIKLRGVDSAGNPVYTKTGTKATGPLALSR